MSLLALVILGGAATSLYLLYRAALPKPFHGIPYHKNTVKNILGDIPPMLRHHKQTNEVYVWFAKQAIELESPIIQLFLKPFGKPKVVITDFLEGHAMLVGSKEFDRSAFVGDKFVGLTPNHHITMPTNATFKHQRRLLVDTMSPAFLTEVAAPQIYTAALQLLQLWERKMRLAKGHSFSAFEDVHCMALDAMWAVTFGEPINTTESQLQSLLAIDTLSLPGSIDEEMEFPHAPTPDAFNSIITLTDTLKVTASSPVPKLSHWFVRQFPAYKTAKAHKDRMIQEALSKVQTKIIAKSEKGEDVNSAIEHMLRREVQAAKKEGRQPEFATAAVQDEIFGLLVAGHETTATTVTWGLKLLTDHPEVQQKLRQSLFDHLAKGENNATMPSARSIAKSDIPYFDAALEEILRHARTTPAIARTAIVDTTILGHRIPKGTDVFVLSNGPGTMSKGFNVHKSLRSLSGKAVNAGEWETDPAAFNPERWLHRNAGGDLEFDPRAGPSLPFGFGVRGCFGKRMAYLELRIMFALIVWSFHLEKSPAALSTYAAVDKITHQPQQCYLRLTPVSHGQQAIPADS